MKNWLQTENTGLAGYAMHAANSRGRLYPEEEHPLRSPYQRDRDRIIHCTAFRRLEYKTQVFVIHEGDYYRTRLTHTIEVAQIARTIARALGINEDLTEAVSLAHDLGHTAFGHSGEETLKELMRNNGGYEHNRQSLRVVDKLEKRYPDFDGLNLTYEVREGIIKHVSEYDNPEVKDFEPGKRPTLEAQVVNLADEIAYTSHDVDDGLKAGLITVSGLADVVIWKNLLPRAEGITDEELFRYKMIRSLIDLLVNNLVGETRRNIEKHGLENTGQVGNLPVMVSFSPQVSREHKELKDFLYENMYRHYRVVRMSEKAKRIITELFRVYLEQPKQLPPAVEQKIRSGETRAQVVCDYIAGMTDNFALEEHKKLFDPFTRV